MGSHPLNLAVRFLLEVVALTSMGVWGWRAGEGSTRFVLAATAPLVAASAWGTFAVPDDPRRSGAAPIAVPGAVRLLVEAAVFGFGVWALRGAGFAKASWALLAIVAVHYAVSYDCIAWLLRR